MEQKVSDQNTTESSWSELLGNPYKYGLHPKMLSDEGYILRTTARVRGMSKTAAKLPICIRFNRSYVIAIVRKTIIEKLRPTDYNQLQAVMSEAWKSWKATQ